MKYLLESVDEIREFVSFSGDLEYDTLKPGIRSAQEFLSRYVGADLITELSGTALSEDQLALLPYLQAAVANLALLKFVNAGNVRITDLGLMRTQVAGSNDAFEWQVEGVKSALKHEAFGAIEALLRYLESVLDKFPAYTGSAPYKAAVGQLIRSAEIFSLYYDIAGSRLVFQTLQASMRTAELSIRKLLGNSLPGLLGADLSEAQAEQLDAARRALVYLTIARALREKLVSISETGVQVCGISNFGTINYKQPASDKQLETSILYFDGQADGFASDLITLLTPAPTTPETTSTGSRVMGTKIVAF